MPRKTARSGSQTPLGRSGMSGAIHPFASGLPASSENVYHPRQFRVHLGNPGEIVRRWWGERIAPVWPGAGPDGEVGRQDGTLRGRHAVGLSG
jgi:hypothetical protein